VVVNFRAARVYFRVAHCRIHVAHIFEALAGVVKFKN